MVNVLLSNEKAYQTPILPIRTFAPDRYALKAIVASIARAKQISLKLAFQVEFQVIIRNGNNELLVPHDTLAPRNNTK